MRVTRREDMAKVLNNAEKKIGTMSYENAKNKQAESRAAIFLELTMCLILCIDYS